MYIYYYLSFHDSPPLSTHFATLQNSRSKLGGILYHLFYKKFATKKPALCWLLFFSIFITTFSIYIINFDNLRYEYWNFYIFKFKLYFQ